MKAAAMLLSLRHRFATDLGSAKDKLANSIDELARLPREPDIDRTLKTFRL